MTSVVLACSSSESASEGQSKPDASASGSGGLSVADSGWGGSAAGAGALPCDPGFAFKPDPPTTSDVLHVGYTDTSPLTYVELQAGSASVSFAGITTSDPWTWTWDVTNLSPGVQTFTFWAGQPSKQLASCQKNVTDTGSSTGGTGGSAGTGGSGGQCCKLVGTQLANPSPCGPSESASPWQTLDNAGCNASGCQKIWCPFEKCDSVKYPNGCPQGTEACWIDNSFATYEDACKSCCESYGACWDAALSTCRHPGDCGTAIGKCPWQP